MLAPIFLLLIAAALLGFAFWLWPGQPPDTTAIPPASPRHQPAALVHEAKTEYLSREDMFRPADRSPPPSAATEILTRPDPAPLTNTHGRDADDMRPTTVFDRDAIASMIKKPR